MWVYVRTKHHKLLFCDFLNTLHPDILPPFFILQAGIPHPGSFIYPHRKDRCVSCLWVTSFLCVFVINPKITVWWGNGQALYSNLLSSFFLEEGTQLCFCITINHSFNGFIAGLYYKIVLHPTMTTWVHKYCYFFSRLRACMSFNCDCHLLVIFCNHTRSAHFFTIVIFKSIN